MASQNPERDTEILRLWDEGKSGGDIVKIMRLPGLTRNVVIGVAQRRNHREGKESTHSAKPSAPKAYKPGPPAAAKHNPRSAAVHRAREAAQAGLGTFSRDSATPSKPPQHFKWEEPGAESVSLLDLAANGCKWPMGDDRMNPMCCGRPRVGDKVPYCQHHEDVAHGRA